MPIPASKNIQCQGQAPRGYPAPPPELPVESNILCNSFSTNLFTATSMQSISSLVGGAEMRGRPLRGQSESKTDGNRVLRLDTELVRLAAHSHSLALAPVLFLAVSGCFWLLLLLLLLWRCMRLNGCRSCNRDGHPEHAWETAM